MIQFSRFYIEAFDPSIKTLEYIQFAGGLSMAVSSRLTTIDLYGREQKPHGDPEFPIACYEITFPPNLIPPHWHEELEFIHVVRGRLYLTAASGKYEISGDTGIFVNSNILHTVTAESSEAEIRSIVFAPSLLGGNEDSIFWKKYLLPIIEDNNLPFLLFPHSDADKAEMIDLVDQVWKNVAEEPHGYELRVRSLLSDFLLRLSDIRDTAGLPPVSSERRRREERLKQMLTYIRGSYSEELTVEKIAQSASISKSECLRCFRDGIGQTPMRYVNQFRLRAAAECLRTTDWPIGEIAAQCGFTEMGYFAACFRKQYGMTPGSYRRRQV